MWTEGKCCHGRSWHAINSSIMIYLFCPLDWKNATHIKILKVLWSHLVSLEFNLSIYLSIKICLYKKWFPLSCYFCLGETKTTVTPFVAGGVSDGQWHTVHLHYYNKVSHLYWTQWEWTVNVVDVFAKSIDLIHEAFSKWIAV